MTRTNQTVPGAQMILLAALMEEPLILYRLKNLPSESRDLITDDSSDEEVPANNLLEFSPDSDEKTIQSCTGLGE
ncbi:hypothetical protein TNCV_2274281 [Trichonephila clavipes]|nr:hypothetical protein TNCV_2274281 [Trichonephila clavipes]